MLVTMCSLRRPQLLPAYCTAMISKSWRRAMTIRAIPLVVSAIFLVLCLAQSTLAHQVHAAGPQLPDPCMAPVGSVRLFIRGGSETPQWVLHGGGNIFSLSLFPDERNSASPPGDTPGVFSFDHGPTMYTGLVHAFRHGARQHLCFGGPVFAETEGNHGRTSVQGIPIRLDGLITGRMVSVTLVVGRATYWVYGSSRVIWPRPPGQA